MAEGIYPKIRGGMVPADEFDEVERLLREYRTSAAATNRGGAGSKLK